MIKTKAEIYSLSHPETNSIFYVGQTSLPLSRRLSSHMANQAPISYEYDKILKDLRNKKKKAIIESLEVVEYSKRKDAEEFWIHTIMSWGFDICNVKYKRNPGYVAYTRKNDRPLDKLPPSIHLKSAVNLLATCNISLEISEMAGCSQEYARLAIGSIIRGEPVSEWMLLKINFYFQNKLKQISELSSKF